MTGQMERAIEHTPYQERRAQIEAYFDRTASETWKKLTSDAPVSGVRATVRAGRERMRSTLLSWLPDDLTGLRVLDAGCGTGALALEAARRGAEVVAVDLSASLIDHANEALPDDLKDRVTFQVGDMVSPLHGRFDHVVAMDSIIHYTPPHMVQMIAQMAALAEHSVLFTHAPRTPLLMAMHTIGQVFPKSDRSPSIVPISNEGLVRRFDQHTALQDWRSGRTFRVNSGFYLSQAMEIVRT